MTLKIAFAGTGGISKVHAQSAKDLGLELVAVVNHRPESMQAFAEKFSIPRQYPTVERLLRAGGVDALIVSTPNYIHSEQSVSALRAGVHVMVEKPMAMNAHEAQEMVTAADVGGALLMVAHCWRFDEEVRWLRNQIQTGIIGPVIRTKGYGVHTHWGPSGWFTQAEFAGGGALADMGIHAIDTARFLMADPQPVSVYAKTDTVYGNYDVDDTGLILISWDNGATSYIESGWWQPHSDGKASTTQLYGKKGFAQLFPSYIEVIQPQSKDVKHIDSGFPAVRDTHAPQSMYDNQLAYFVDCIQQGRTPVPGGAEGLINMKIVDAAYASSRTGKVIEI